MSWIFLLKPSTSFEATNVIVDGPLHFVVVIVRVDSEVVQRDGEVLDWRETVGGPWGETVWTRHVPLSQSDQVDRVGGGLKRTTII